MRVHGVENGYVVRVTLKIVFYVTEPDIFKSKPPVRRIRNNNGVCPMRPYYSGGMEGCMVFVQNYPTWANMTEEFPYRD